jgi:predicted dienelactone hydrolase
MRHVTLIAAIALAASGALAQYPVATADATFNDPDRQDRPVPCDLYYPADQSGAPYPVVAVGHGFVMDSDLYSWIGERLAGAGFVTAIPRTGGELFPDHAVFAADLAFATRALVDAGQDPGSILFGLTASTRGVLGHSMGGGAGLLAAAGDPGIGAVASLAAAETSPSAIAACAQLSCPALLLAGSNDCVTPPADHQVPMFAAMSGNWRTLAVLDGASHCQFAADSFICGLGESCSADITRQLQWDRSWLLLEPWLKAVLGGDPEAAATFGARIDEAQAWALVEQAGAPSPAPVPAPRLSLQARPNPFNPTTWIRFELEQEQPVTLEVFDLGGRRVGILLQQTMPAGPHAVRWSGQDSNGLELASGTYLVRLVAGPASGWLKLTLAR